MFVFLFICLFICFFFFYLFFNFFLFINLFAPYLLKLKMFMSTYSNWGVFFFWRMISTHIIQLSQFCIVNWSAVSPQLLFLLTENLGWLIALVMNGPTNVVHYRCPAFDYFPWCSFNYETFAFQDHWHDLFVFLNGSKKKWRKSIEKIFGFFSCAKIRQFSLIIKRHIQCVLNSRFDHSHFKVKWTIIDVSLMN